MYCFAGSETFPRARWPTQIIAGLLARSCEIGLEITGAVAWRGIWEALEGLVFLLSGWLLVGAPLRSCPRAGAPLLVSRTHETNTESQARRGL